MSKLRLIPYAVLAVGGLIAATGAANAQSMYDINQRQGYQQHRIAEGMRSGQITRGEAWRLQQGERDIDRAQGRAMADGRISPWERNNIQRMTDAQGRQIYQESHDRRQAWDRGAGRGNNNGGHNGWGQNDREGWGRAGHGNNHNWGHNGWDNRGSDRVADRRDWGRGHNNGSWNNGRDHNGWNRGDAASNGWNHNHGGNGGWPHNGGIGTGTGTGTGTHSWGNWNRSGSTGSGTHGWGNWGGQTRQVSAPAPTTGGTRNYTTNNTGSRGAGGGRSGGHR